MPRLRNALHFLPLLLLGACTSIGQDNMDRSVSLTPGPWRMELFLKDVRIPFQFDLKRTDDHQGWEMHVRNAEEVIVASDIVLSGDSIRIRMPLFDSEFIGLIQTADRMEGLWHNYLKGPEYTIPFVAVAGSEDRFVSARSASADISGRWATRFTPEKDEAYPGIGLFRQSPSGRVTGTFMTETGDYRYLEGTVSGDSLLLSCFDGSHAFLFAAHILQDGMEGRFWSGTHWETSWTAHKDAGSSLRHPDSLTHLREGYDMVDFRFPDLQGRMVSPKDDAFKNKVLLVQIMGSWCPNCVDETRLLNEMYSRYHQKGLEILSVAFEKHADTVRAVSGLRRFRDVLDVRYPILYAGLASKDKAAEKLPFLDHVMSYPTCIMVDRRGNVRRIRTGIYGPSTGAHYDAYREHLGVFLEQLLAESDGTEIAGR